MVGVISKNKKMIILIIVVILLLCGLFLFINWKKNSKTNDIFSSNAFFIANEEGNFALFNIKGKQLTDFEFSATKSFDNNVAIVYNKDQKVGLIDSNGKMVVDFGTYSSIYQKGLLFKVYNDDYDTKLINAKGEVVADLENNELHSFSTQKLITVLETKDEYHVLDYMGEVLFKVKKVKDKEFKLYGNYNEYISFYYNGVTYLIDGVNCKLITKIEDSDAYCVSSYNTLNKEEYVLSTCKDGEKFRFMRKEKIVFTDDDKCNNLFFEYDNNNLICAATDGKRYLVNDKLDFGLEIYYNDVAYFDNDNYAEKKDSKNTELVVNGKAKTLECYIPSSVASIKKELYILKNMCDKNKNMYSYFDKEGKRINDEFYKRASKFDDNDIAIVSKDGNKKFLINLAGETISKEYDSIYKRYDLYECTSGDEKIVVGTSGKELISTEEDVSILENYYIVENSTTTIYYTHSGKEFYTVKKK